MQLCYSFETNESTNLLSTLELILTQQLIGNCKSLTVDVLKGVKLKES